MDNMIFTSEVCGVVLIAPFDKISRPPCSTIRFIVFLSLFFRCFSPFSFYHRTFSLTTEAARQGKENLCQPKEIGSLLEEIYHGRCVSANASERMRAMLSQQQINHKIPSLLPPTVRVEHKTGEDEGITNDVGILYGREPCVLVFVSNETDVPAFEQVIRTVSLHYTRV